MVDIDVMGIVPYDEKLRRDRLREEQQREQQFQVERQSQSRPWFSLSDMLAAPFRGFEGFIQGLYSLGDAVLGDALPDYDERFLRRSKSVFGGFAEIATQFSLGFLPVVGWVGRGANIGMRAGQGARYATPGLRLLSTSAQASRTGRAATFTELGRFAAAGAITDFSVFDAHEERLSNLIQSIPEAQNFVTEFLASDQDDSEFGGRMKNALEGLVIGSAIDALVLGVRAAKTARKARESGASPEDTAKAVDEVVGDGDVIRQAAEDVRADEIKKLRDQDVEGWVNDEGVFTKVLEDGSTARVRKETLPGQKKPVWVDNETGQQIPGTTTKTTLNELNDILGAPQRPRRPAARVKAKPIDVERIDKFIASMGDRIDIGGQNVNPRDLDPDSLLELAIERSDVNLADYAADPAAAQRALKDVYKKVHQDVIGDAVYQQQAFEKAHDLFATPGENPQFAPMTTAKNVDDAIAEMGVLKLVGEAQARKIIKLAKEKASVRSEELPSWRARMQEEMELANRVDDEMKGIEAGAGRLLRSLRKDVGVYARLRDTLDIDAAGSNLDEVADLIAEATKHGGPIEVVASQLRRDLEKTSIFQLTQDVFINSILLNGKTIVINPLSGMGMAFYRPFRLMLGSTIRGDFPGVHEAVDQLITLVTDFREAMRPAMKSFRENRALLTETSAFTEFTEGGAQKRPLSGTGIMEAFGKNPEANPKATEILDHLSKFYSVSSNFMVATDEFVKQLSFRSQAKARIKRVLRSEHPDWNPVKIAAETDLRMADMIYRHQAVTEQVLFQKHYRALEGDNFFPDEISRRREASRRASLEFNKKDSALTRAVTEEAVEGSKYDTFQTEIDPSAGMLDRFTVNYQNFTKQHPTLRFFTPFIRTPFNIFKAASEHSFGVGTAAIQKFSTYRFGKGLQKVTNTRNKLLREFQGEIDLRGLDPNSVAAREFQQNARSQAAGKAATGMSIMAFGFGLAGQDLITGRGPTDREQRALLEQNGWLPYSIKIGNTYVQYKRLDPISTLLGTIADLHTIGKYAPVDDQDQLDQAFGAVMMALVNNVTQKSYMTGIRNLTELMFQPDQSASRVIGSFTGAFIPALWAEGVSAFTTGEDQTMREATSFIDEMFKRVPYYTEGLDPVRNFMGEAVRKVRFGLEGDNPMAAVTNMFSPIAHRSVSDDFIANEIAGLQHAFSPPRVSLGGIDLRSFRNQRGQSAYDRMLELRGQVKIGQTNLKQSLRKLIRSSSYQRMSPLSTVEVDSPRIQAINNVVQRYARRAKKQMLREFPDVNLEQLRVRRELLSARRGGFDFSQLQER